MRHILFSYRSPKYIDEQPQPCLGCRHLLVFWVEKIG